MDSTDRNFYHSFPRIRHGDNHETILKDGLKILKSVHDIGLILAPELVEWKQLLVDGTTRSTIVRQNRISFTELAVDEVKEHGKKFGPFSLEFKVDTLRRLGALPVIYMPRYFSDNSHFSSLASTIVGEISDIKYTVTLLHQLSQMLNINYLKTLDSSAETISPDAVFNLQNGDEKEGIVQNTAIPFKNIEGILKYIGYKNAPFELMIGVLNAVQSLFYPTDSEIGETSLNYYRQREWRLIGGFALKNIPQSRTLTPAEKVSLAKINSFFWNKELNDGKISLKRIDEATVINSYDDNPIKDAIAHIYVPDKAFDEARELFGDKVLKN